MWSSDDQVLRSNPCNKSKKSELSDTGVILGEWAELRVQSSGFDLNALFRGVLHANVELVVDLVFPSRNLSNLLWRESIFSVRSDRRSESFLPDGIRESIFACNSMRPSWILSILSSFGFVSVFVFVLLFACNCICIWGSIDALFLFLFSILFSF